MSISEGVECESSATCLASPRASVQNPSGGHHGVGLWSASTQSEFLCFCHQGDGEAPAKRLKADEPPKAGLAPLFVVEHQHAQWERLRGTCPAILCGLVLADRVVILESAGPKRGCLNVAAWNLAGKHHFLATQLLQCCSAVFRLL